MTDSPTTRLHGGLPSLADQQVRGRAGRGPEGRRDRRLAAAKGEARVDGEAPALRRAEDGARPAQLYEGPSAILWYHFVNI